MLRLYQPPLWDAEVRVVVLLVVVVGLLTVVVVVAALLVRSRRSDCL